MPRTSGSKAIPVPVVRVEIARLRLPATTVQMRSLLYGLDETFKRPEVHARTAGGRMWMIVTADK